MHSTTYSAKARWLVLLAAFLGWMFDGLEMGIFPLVARPALSDLMGMSGDELVGQWMGRITALFLLGAACGGLIFGWLGDRLGRVRAMTFSIVTYSLFTGLCYFAAQPWHLGALRFVAALGMGGEWSLGVALVMECWPEGSRPVLAGLIGAAANVGYALIGVVGLRFHIRPDSWRWVMLAGAAPALLTFFITLFVPESERWKESVKTAVARPVREIFSPALRATTLLAIVFASVALIGTWSAAQWMPLWVDKLAGPDLPQAKAWAQVCSALGAIVGCMIGPLLGAWLGRRPAYFCLCLASLLSCGYLYRGWNEYNNTLLGMIFVVGGASAAFYGWLPLYLPELFPTRVRATGQGLCFNSGRILAAVGSVYAGELVKHYHGDYARAGATITLVYLLGMVVIWMAPETKGRPLPE
ncbi:MAG: MFS transporter [Planctomycetota bacterium]